MKLQQFLNFRLRNRLFSLSLCSFLIVFRSKGIAVGTRYVLAHLRGWDALLLRSAFVPLSPYCAKSGDQSNSPDSGSVFPRSTVNGPVDHLLPLKMLLRSPQEKELESKVSCKHFLLWMGVHVYSHTHAHVHRYICKYAFLCTCIHREGKSIHKLWKYILQNSNSDYLWMIGLWPILFIYFLPIYILIFPQHLSLV